MDLKTLRPIDLVTILGLVATAYFFREAMVAHVLTWQIVILGFAGFVLGLVYHFRGDAIQTSERTHTIFLLSYAAMIVPAIIAKLRTALLFAWAVFGPLAVPFLLPIYFGWGMPMFFGREAPQV